MLNRRFIQLIILVSGLGVIFLFLVAFASPLKNKVFPALYPVSQADTLPKGAVTTLTCDGGIIGWTCDPDDYAKTLGVHVYVDGQHWEPDSKIIASVLAALPNSAATGNCGGNSNHGFAIRIPDILLDGQPHAINLYAIDHPDPVTNPSIGGATLTCSDRNAVNSNLPSSGYPPIITVDAAKPIGNVSSSLLGDGINPINTGFDVPTRSSGLMYFDDINSKTVKPQLFSTIENLKSPFIRGMFNHGVHWTNSIGDYDLRPQKYGNVLPDYCYTCTDDKKFGIDEFLTYVEKMGSTPLLMVNSANTNLDTNLYPFPEGSNSNNPKVTPQEIAAEVAYTNGNPTDTKLIGIDENNTDWKTVGFWAQKRADNGHAAPYNVKYWEFGNEVFAEVPGQTATQYAQRYLSFQSAMKNVDPTIKLGIVTKNNEPVSQWNKDIFTTAGSKIDFLINHDYLSADIKHATLFNNWWVDHDVNISSTGTSTFTFNALTDPAASSNGTLRVCWDEKVASNCSNPPAGYNRYQDITVPRSFQHHPVSFSTPSLSIGNHHFMFVAKTTSNINFEMQMTRNDTITFDFVPEKELFAVKMGELENSLTNLYMLRQTYRNIVKSSPPPIANTEYNTYYAPSTAHADLAGVLSVAGMIERYLFGKLDMATFYSMINHAGPIDNDDWFVSIGHNIEGNAFWPNPLYYTLQLFTRHFGTNLVQNYISSPVFEANHLEYRGKGLPTLAVETSTNQAGDILYISVINKSYDQDIATQINLDHFTPSANGYVWTIGNVPGVALADKSIKEADPQKNIRIVPSFISDVSNNFTYTFPAHSVTVIEIPSNANTDQSRISIQAFARASTTPPRMLLWVNGDHRGEWEINAPRVQSYSVTIPKLKLGDEVEIVYANQTDAQQPLEVQSITVDGENLNPANTTSGITFKPGLLYGAIGPGNEQPGKNILSENGALLYRYGTTLNPTPPPTPEPNVYDLNGDGALDTADFVLFKELYPVQDIKLDFNTDGNVNSLDFNLFKKAY